MGAGMSRGREKEFDKMSKKHEQEVKKTRQKVYYQIFADLLEEIEKAGCKGEILMAVHSMMDKKRMFKYHSHAVSSHNSIKQLIKDKLPKDAFLMSI